MPHTSRASRGILPELVLGRINPTVFAERAALVQARLADHGRTRVLRRRCAEIVADHLLKTLDAAEVAVAEAA